LFRMEKPRYGTWRVPARLNRGFLATLVCGWAIAVAPVSAQTAMAFNPFTMVSDRADLHLMAYFDGHPEYEAVEAYVYQTGHPRGKPAIRAIVTRHGGAQEDYVNGQGTGTHGVQRERHPVDIILRQAANGSDWFLGFSLADGQECAFVYVAANPPDPSYGGLTDVGTHSADGGLPLFWREASGMGTKASYVRIGATRYPVCPDPSVSRPPFFYGCKAYLTVGMNGMILPTGRFEFPRREEPAQAAESLSCVAGATADMRLQFTPPLPDWRELAVGESRVLRFAFQFPSAPEACAGSLKLSRTSATQAQIEMDPVKPGWAASTRRMVYLIEEGDDSVVVTSRMRDVQP
jgi:hypothetical protein